MIVVKPDEERVQHREDVVIYLLPFSDWNGDLENPENKEARISTRAIRGNPVSVKVLPYRPGSQAHEVQVTGGNRRTRCEIIRVIRAKNEVRRKSFIVTVREV